MKTSVLASLDQSAFWRIYLMRSKLLAVLVGCGLVAATMATALACDYKTNATNDKAAPQETAQSQSQTPAPSETHSN